MTDFGRYEKSFLYYYNYNKCKNFNKHIGIK